MARRSLAWRMFNYNLVVILVLIGLTAITFNVAVGMYVEQDIREQLNRIATRAELSVLRRPGPGPYRDAAPQGPMTRDLFFYYFSLDRALRAPLTVLNADYILLDERKNPITFLPADFETSPPEVAAEIQRVIRNIGDEAGPSYVNFEADGMKYVAVVKPMAPRNPSGVGWIIIYSGLQKLHELQTGVNLILLAILLVAAAISLAVSFRLAQRITAPFASLSGHIRAIAERNFGTKIDIPVDIELQQFVDSVNAMSEKLQKHDKAQKTFLQNASHEFRTPLMAIQSYAEGIKHDVVEKGKAADIIIEETRRLTHMVEDLLYLSRLDSIEEPYGFKPVAATDVIRQCLERGYGLAANAGKSIAAEGLELDVVLHADEEKLVRALFNVLNNSLRYAREVVSVRAALQEGGMLEITIADDGPGIHPADLPHIFDRFYKGEKGLVGLGLAITKNIVQRHGGAITAENADPGAVFRITLPVAEAPAAGRSGPAARPPQRRK